MRLVLLESPYAGDVGRNIVYARRCVLDCLHRGESPIASHLLFTQPGILNDAIPEQRALGIAAGLAWLPVAQQMVLYTDLGMSDGMQRALETARQANVSFIMRSLQR